MKTVADLMEAESTETEAVSDVLRDKPITFGKFVAAVRKTLRAPDDMPIRISHDGHTRAVPDTVQVVEPEHGVPYLLIEL